MHASVTPKPECDAGAIGSFTLDDPLDPDLPDDTALLTTRRALCRVAMVAAEAGARFQREADPTDPMAWMLSPRRMFGGAPPIEACLERGNFVRAVVLHGLSLGMDADPGSLDELIEEEPEVFDRLAADHGPDARRGLSRPQRGRSGKGTLSARPTLYCATIAYEGDGVMLQAFHASVARHPGEVVQRLRARFGEEVVVLAEIRSGFDPARPLAIALVPTAVATLLKRVERNSDNGRYGAFSYDTEQRLEI